MEKIFVSIASFLDPEFMPTIEDCFSKAKYPERIFIGLHLQDKKEVLERLHGLNKNVRVIKTDYKIGEGCGWARNEIMKQLFKNEDYFLLVDSHSRFKKNWDEIYIKKLNSLPKKSVISAFPRSYEFGETYDMYSKRDIPSIYIPNDITFIRGVEKPHKQRLAQRPHEKIMNISGGNTFGPGSVVEALTIEDFSFYGHQEQEIYSLLLYKCGYNIYAINENLIWHKYFTIGKDNYRELYKEKGSKNNFWPALKNHGCNIRTADQWLKEYEAFCYEPKK